jgi:hypothetical protein
VQLQVQATRANTLAIGTRLWLTAGGQTQVGFVNGGNGFASQSTRRVHFGVGQAQRIERLEVAWPSGTKQTYTDVPLDRIHTLVEGQAQLQPFQANGQK